MDKPVTPTGAPPLLTVRATPLAPGLDPRSSAVLREIVEQYVETGEPVGSRTLSRRLPLNVSPATIRNVMADLTDAGLLYAPHTSAGRLPTERGLLHFGELTEEERTSITAALGAAGAGGGRKGRRIGERGGGESGVRHRWVSGSTSNGYGGASNGYGGGSQPKRQGLAFGMQPDDQRKSSLPSLGEGGSHQPTEIRRGCASLAFGNVSVSTPSSSCALICS
jgi:hypothetical protein